MDSGCGHCIRHTIFYGIIIDRLLLCVIIIFGKSRQIYFRIVNLIPELLPISPASDIR